METLKGLPVANAINEKIIEEMKDWKGIRHTHKNNFKVFIVIILLGNKGMCLYILYIV